MVSPLYTGRTHQLSTPPFSPNWWVHSLHGAGCLTESLSLGPGKMCEGQSRVGQRGQTWGLRLSFMRPAECPRDGKECGVPSPGRSPHGSVNHAWASSCRPA